MTRSIDLGRIRMPKLNEVHEEALKRGLRQFKVKNLKMILKAPRFLLNGGIVTSNKGHYQGPY